MSSAVVERPLRRSLFFVPGGEPRKLEKSRSIEADTLLLDLEDSVALSEKDRARKLVSEFLREGDFGGSEPAVRVNPPGTPYFDEDLAAAVRAGAAAIMIPKSEDPRQLAEVGKRIEALEGDAADHRRGATRILALVETAAGIVHAAALSGGSPRIDALCFGHADFSRDMQLAAADASRGAAFHGRCALAIAARATGLAPIDTVHLDVRNQDAFREDTALGIELGFEGKLCIHPAQVGLANELYTPTEPQIEYAERVLEAHEKARSEGRGVFTVDGKMVDAPLIAAQERVLEKARRAGVRTSSESSDDA